MMWRYCLGKLIECHAYLVFIFKFSIKIVKGLDYISLTVGIYLDENSCYLFWCMDLKYEKSEFTLIFSWDTYNVSEVLFKNVH